MQRLSGVDSMFLYLETPTNHMHVAGVFLLDPQTAPDGFSFAQVHSMVAQRLDRAAAFRRRVVEVPFRFAHPVWIEDPDFDLDFHVHRAALPSPGGRPELEDFLGQVVALPLDRKRPLWELYLVEGLENGLQAAVVKIHHAAIDGVSGAELSASWLDLEPDPPAQTGTDDWRPERVPGEVDLVVDAWAQLVSGRLTAARAARRLAETVVHVTKQHRDLGQLSPPLPFSAPRTPFNLAITPHRCVSLGEVALEDLKAVKDRFHCTVNDVVLALCAGALRRYLTGRGELPAEPLVGFVPISVRGEKDLSTSANRLSAVLTSLASDVADPVERLHIISAVMSEAKTQHSRIGADAITDWTEFTLPALIGRASRLISSFRVFDHVRPAFNVTISNIPGPTFPLYLAGARVIGIYPLGPVVEGAGLNMTAMSYCGVVYFGLNGCRETVPDLGSLPSLITESLEELLVASRVGEASNGGS